MVVLNRIYTRTGDEGTTMLAMASVAQWLRHPNMKGFLSPSRHKRILLD